MLAGRGTECGAEWLVEAVKAVEGRLPGHAHIRKEVEWVAANLHRDDPDPETAPSMTAINMLLDVRASEALRRDFWNIVLAKRLSPGEPKSRPEPMDNGEDGALQEETRKSFVERYFGTETEAT